MKNIKNNLPFMAGTYHLDYSMKNLTYLRIGGTCDIFFSPADVDDLVYFLQTKDQNLPTICLGKMSNIIILDGGIEGCVINLTNSLQNIHFFEDEVIVEAGVLLYNFIQKCMKLGISCCEQMFMIPGTIGGAIFMNAGMPDFEISDVLQSIRCLDQNGCFVNITKKDLKMSYRNGNIPKNYIIISATLRIYKKPQKEIADIIQKIQQKRLATQPITEFTCGSTFKNPNGKKAWQLISEAGCQNLFIGDACVSNMHCNFLINKGQAKAKDFLRLITIIKTKVLEKTSILLEEEIIILGRQ